MMYQNIDSGYAYGQRHQYHLFGVIVFLMAIKHHTNENRV